MRTLCLILVATALACQAGNKKKEITNEAGNDNVDITANPLLLADEIKTALGDNLPTGIIAVQVKLVPKGEMPLSISANDFLLISHKDGQRSGAYQPSQIAGSATMVVKTQTVGGQTVGRQRNSPVWSGGPIGGGGVGNSASNETKTSVELKEDAKNAQSPLLKLLGEKMLPQKETSEPVEGLLYFPLDGKVKTKDLELIYQGPAGRLYVNFR